jgi:seryl-tRNA synthetase
MIDLALLREDPKTFKEKIYKKDPTFESARLIQLESEVREIQLAVEALRKKKNDLSKLSVGGKVSDDVRTESIALSKELALKEKLLEKTASEFDALYLSCPNIPDSSVPVGNKAENVVVREWGTKPNFSFPLKNHVELCERSGALVDFDIATKLAGTNFAFYGPEGTKLLYALSMFMLKNNMEHGFTPYLPSVLVRENALTVSGNFPKFRDGVFQVSHEKENLFLTPTAEVNLTNIYTDHIFSAEELPIRMTAWTSCFRTEGGGYGAHERGLIRLRQFEKVELVSICTPEKSYDELDRMVGSAESILQKLGLHYRVSLLAGQDCSFQSAKTYDIEVWLPGQKEYKEISSASNCTDFQARRGLIRYRAAAGQKTKYVHTLNASSLALPRLMVAIMETYQQADGTIQVPEVLRNFGIY